jgi:hypothetical protein
MRIYADTRKAIMPTWWKNLRMIHKATLGVNILSELLEEDGLIVRFEDWQYIIEGEEKDVLLFLLKYS